LHVNFKLVEKLTRKFGGLTNLQEIIL